MLMRIGLPLLLSLTLCVPSSLAATTFDDISAKIFVGKSHQAMRDFKEKIRGKGKGRRDKDFCLQTTTGSACTPQGFEVLITPKGSYNRIGLDWSRDTRNWMSECDAARIQKIKYHLTQDSGDIPDSFGKIIEWTWAPHATQPSASPAGGGSDFIERWVGSLKLCTWIGDDEYYFEINISEADLYRNTTNPDPFPGTLDLSKLDSDARDELRAGMAQWNFKLHAAGTNISINVARRNNRVIKDASNNKIPELTNPVSTNCFDIFFTGNTSTTPTTPPSSSDPLPDQLSYCMGRCDALMLNTR